MKTVQDDEGNEYGTVKIGNQVWMTSNLRATKYNDGVPITNYPSAADWLYSGFAGYCSYNNTTNVDTIKLVGLEYNYAAASSGKLCPKGWHVPSDSDWTVLSKSLGALAGGRLKETDTLHWASPNTDAINDTHFNAVPSGYRESDGNYYNFRVASYWWSNTVSTNGAILYVVNKDKAELAKAEYYTTSGFAVRCLKN